MLPLVSVFALSASFASASAYNLRERDTCSCLSPAASTFANSATVSDAANKATTPSGYTNTANNGQTWAPGDGWLGFVDVDDYDSTVCAGLCDTITECSSFQICESNVLREDKTNSGQTLNRMQVEPHMSSARSGVV